MNESELRNRLEALESKVFPKPKISLKNPNSKARKIASKIMKRNYIKGTLTISNKIKAELSKLNRRDPEYRKKYYAIIKKFRISKADMNRINSKSNKIIRGQKT